MLGEPSANSPGLLWAKIKWQILLILVNFPQCSLLFLRNHCQHLSNGQPHHLTETTKQLKKKPPSSLTKNLTQTKPNQHIRLKTMKFRFYILESLLGAPPVTLATRSKESSALRSFN